MKGAKLRIEDVMTLRFDSSNIEIIRDDYNGAFKPTVGQGTPHSSGLGTLPGTGSMNPQGGTQPIQQSAQSTGHGLLVKIAATHSGLITRNNGFYLPDKMRSGATSWTDNYPKPIQVHHDEHKDPIGRVVSARYVETIGQVVDKFNGHSLRDSAGRDTGVTNEQFWKDFVSPKTSFMRKVEMVQMMDSVLEDPNYAGVGYIELIADITDPESVQKILDGRYLTGSVGAITDKAVCSVCRMDWLEDGQCEHKPGREYDGRKAFVIAGSLSYDEYSFVNRPADRHSGVIEINYGNIKNSVESEARDSTKYESEVTLQDKLENDAMKVENDLLITSEKNEEVATTKPIVEAPADKIAEQENTDSSEKAEDRVAILLDKAFSKDAELTKEDVDALYDLMAAELKEEGFEDATLSAEKRKKLPKSVFCGPSRSFPVPDCAHVTAARRLVNRYKGEGDKSTILACVERKAKAMGCDSAKDSFDNQPRGEKQTESKKLNISIQIEAGDASNEEKMGLAKSLVSELVTALGKDAVSEAVVDAGIALDPSIEDTLASDIEKYETHISNLTDELSLLRRELASLLSDVANLEDQLIDSKTNNRSVKSSYVKVLATLKGDVARVNDADLTELSDEALEATMKTLSTEVDISKIADSLNSGLSKSPNIKVEPPVGETEPPAEQTKPKQTPSHLSIQWTDEVYRRILVNEGNYDKAKKFKDEMIRQGLYPAPKSE